VHPLFPNFWIEALVLGLLVGIGTYVYGLRTGKYGLGETVTFAIAAVVAIAIIRITGMS
jgi:hypothetical protein